jgi:hypothetical protein
MGNYFKQFEEAVRFAADTSCTFGIAERAY